MDANQIRFAIFIAVFLLMLGLESIIQRHPTVDCKTRRLKINFALTGIDILVVRLFFGAAAVGAAQFSEERGWGLFNYLQWPEGLEIFLCIIILDLMIYIQHVVLHRIPFFWRFHIVHHSDLDLDVSSGLRFHPIEIMGSMLFKIGLVFALGPSPMTVLIFEAILNGMAQFSHSNIALPESLDRLLRYVIVTPDMHRIHHSIEKRETNSNFGFNLSIWDRFLGTYIHDALKTQERIIIGVNSFRTSEEVSFKNLLMMPFRKIPRDPSGFLEKNKESL
ncbi:MAG: sterol desaturase family protein [Nitrospinaceae bacterium]|jgi:sterol desaturase/sphingolipid hydroxylase (fatty acid hydroxylase superfamily)|nr:sterol desaturase family protein [Nitrospinaceae bacterium]MBT6347064.1 sterol desaturase family protein [Nitrospina sp.]